MRTHARITALAIAVLVGGLLWAIPAAPASPTHHAAVTVLSIYQAPARITEHSSFSVHLEVASATNIQQMYFTFCQLSSSLCYLPVTMVQQQGTNWFAGTTNAMSTYSGMNPGVVGGYNITIKYNDGTNSTEPVLPNPFTNLTLNQSVTGEHMFQIVVSPDVFQLSGHVADSVTGAAIAEANVSLTPARAPPTMTDASGAYSFPALINGTYTITVTKAGYATEHQQVSISGTPVTKDVSLSSSDTTVPPTKTSSGWGFLATPTGGALVAVVVAVVLLGVILAVRQRRKGLPPTPPAEPTPPSAGSGGPGST